MNSQGSINPLARKSRSRSMRVESRSRQLANETKEKDKALIAACLQGDKMAWDTFVLRYSDLVYHTITKTLRQYQPLRSQILEDLYQEFFVSILRVDFKKLRQFRGDRGCSLASWIRLVATRLCIDFCRRGNSTRVEVSDTVEGYRVYVLDDPSDSEDEKLLLQAIETLPPRDRLLLDLCFRQDLAPAEIAVILKTSVNAIYAQKSRVLDKLREIIRRSGLV